MNNLIGLDKRVHDLSLKQFQIRQKAKFCVCLIMIIQTLLRCIGLFWDQNITHKSFIISLIALPFSIIMIVIIPFEYFLFKKKGIAVVKYSKIVDLILLLCFIGDWMAALATIFYGVLHGPPVSIGITASYTFTAFSWRTLMVTLLVQKWQLKIIAPVVALTVVTGFVIHYAPHNLGFMIPRVLGQIFNVILIIYIEDKVRWKLMRTNVEQEKWMQVSNFILDSIPENIMILDMEGALEEAKLMSDSCKRFLKKWNFELEIQDFFRKVQELKQQQQHCEPSSDSSSSMSNIQVERIVSLNGIFIETNPTEQEVMPSVETLEDLVRNFKTISKRKGLQERQFLVYNGKLKLENQDKSIEVKISFVHHLDEDYVILIFRDTTQRDLLITLEETNKYKDQLLASVSHELRAPLNGNINLVESAVNSLKIPQSIKDDLLIPALRSSKFLLHLINDILDMSQIREQKLRLVFHSEDLRETLKNTIQLVEFQAKKKEIELVVNLDPHLPKNFCTDHLRVSQIVLNLLTNATKFTREGAIKLTAKSANDDGSWVKISVQDSGIGISQENMNKLFSSYTYIDFEGRQTMNPSGVGLGLNIASHLVHLLSPEAHPNINVKTTPNKGSMFSFVIENKENSLPRQLEQIQELENSSCSLSDIAEEFVGSTRPITLSKPHITLITATSFHNRETAKSELLLSQTCSCPKILIVDDNPFNTMALETILSSLDIKCDSVYNGYACIQKLMERQSKTCGAKGCKQFSVIFMDQEMPEMSGSETVREIKRLQSENLLPDMKIIGCTAHKAKEEVDKFLGAGLDKCIFKPVSIMMIKDILKETLSK